MKKLNLTIRKLLLKDYLYILLAIIALSYAFYYIEKPKYSIFNDDETSFKGILNSYTIEGDKLSFILDTKEKLKCNYYFKSEEELNEYQRKLKLGMTLEIKGSLSNPANNTVPNTFNYKEYLYYHGIFYICKVEKLKIINESESNLYKIKNKIIKRIKSFDSISEYLLTFIIGDKSLLNEDVFNTYRKNGVTHLFAISGMHIGLFSVTIMLILKKLKVSEIKRYLITIIFIWFYAFLTAFTPSVLRAGLLFTLLSLNKIFYTEIKSINILILTGVLLVLIRPFILMDIGFIYSYATTFGLMYGNNFISKHKILGTSIVAFIFSLPITINNFYEVNMLSILLNIIFVPYVSSIVYPLCLLTYIFRILEPITTVFINIMEYMSVVFNKVDYLDIIIPKMNIVFVILYYIILLVFLNKRFRTCLIGLTAILIISFNLYKFDNNYYIEFLDVGQGDSILIRLPKNKEVILIDTGGVISYKTDNWKKRKKYHISDNTINYLHSLGINKLDSIILTHGDADHMGETINIVNNFKVDEVIFNCGTLNGLEKELIKVLDKREIKYYSCIKELNIDKDKLYFLQTKEYDNENDNSNVIYTELDGYKFMFMGDASSTTEKEILDKYNLPDIDVLKVGHHGSKTSSSKEFISEINPKYSIISVGKNNRYGHPNKEVLKNLKDSKIYRTDQDGSIMFKIKNNKLKIETCSP